MNLDEIVKVGKRLLAAEKRNFMNRKTLLSSKLIKQKPCIDLDKKVFLIEVLKLLAHADAYFRKYNYVAFYNAALAITFMCVQTKQYTLAEKVYSMFG